MVHELASELGVSPHTIRRDINALCEKAERRRLHGGAEFIEGTMNIAYPTRSVLNLPAKHAIARAVAPLIENGASLFFSIGTTPAIVAAALSDRKALTVVTNNLNAALALSRNESNWIIIPGGEIWLPDRDIVGSSALETVAAYRAAAVGGISKMQTKW
jgi:DeoR family glycerol-3-phosphate regulon repressor